MYIAHVMIKVQYTWTDT